MPAGKILALTKYPTMSKESKRQQRFAGVIQKDLADIFQREGNAWAPGAFVTVTRVRMTPDLAIARVFLSFLNAKSAASDFAALQSHSNEIRFKLGTRIRNHARVVPHLEFFLDDTSAYVERMDELFDKISKEPRQEED